MLATRRRLAVTRSTSSLTARAWSTASLNSQSCVFAPPTIMMLFSPAATPSARRFGRCAFVTNTDGRRGKHRAAMFCQGPEGCRRMTAVPVGPGTCRRCSRSTPLSVSAARSMSALASVPTCAIAVHCEVSKVTAFRLDDTCRRDKRHWCSCTWPINCVGCPSLPAAAA